MTSTIIDAFITMLGLPALLIVSAGLAISLGHIFDLTGISKLGGRD